MRIKAEQPAIVEADETTCDEVSMEQTESLEKEDKPVRKDFASTMKKIVWLCLLNGIFWRHWTRSRSQRASLRLPLRRSSVLCLCTH